MRVDAGGYGVSWNDELDVDATTLYEEGVLIEVSAKAGTDINRMLAYRLAMAREEKGITQKELAEGLDMNLVIGFEPKNNIAV